ncbi:MAG: response regulator transcription factor [Bacteroidetes bacterium]|nr:MAG: response regulator transcription factor [Bacteroidota bacterium]
MSIQIAIADDHELFRSGIRNMLGNHGDFKVVVEASSGVDLLEKLGYERVDILLLDVDMPEMNGTEALQQIRAKYPETKVLMLTMYNHDEHMLYYLKNGASAYLLKDMSVEEMCTAIRAVFYSGQYLTNKAARVLLDEEIKSPDAPIALSAREQQVLRLICMEKTTSEIAEELFLSPRTVETYRKQLLEKTNSKNIAGLVRYALERKGLI